MTKFKETEIGKIPKDWEIKQLQEISKVIDSAHMTPKYSSEGFSMVRVTDIKKGFLNLKESLKVSKKIYDEFTRNHIPRKNDIVMTRVGTYGVASFVNTDELFCLGQNTVVIHSLFSSFIYQALNSKLIQNQIEERVVGSTQKTISLRDIRELLVAKPKKIVEIKRIADILYDLESKIEHLKQQNKILEQILQTIFKSWFVDFDGQTEFVDSELGSIPKGWKVSSINELCQKSENGGTPRRNNSDYWKNGTISWFKTGELGDGPLFDSEEHITDLGLKESSCKLWAPGTILIAMYGATASKIGFLTTFTTSNQACNALLAKNDYGNMFLFFLLKYYQDTLSKYVTGSAQPNLNKDIISNFQIILPTSLICKKFQNISFALFEKIIENSKKIFNLIKIRDSLLPKLMSGEIRV